MASTSVQESVDAPAAAVWQLLSDFGGVRKISDPRFISNCECDGNEVGCVRTITLADGSSVKERLESLEHQSRRFSYSIVGEAPLPVKDYLATVKVTETGSDSCQVDWQSTFEATGPVEKAEKLIRGVYTGGVACIRKVLGA